MLSVGDQFDVSYAGNKKVTCVCLAGRKFARLMAVLQRLQDSSDSIEADLFDNGIPEALGICLGDTSKAEHMWENEITLRDAIEILTNAVGGHVLSDDQIKK